MSLDEVIESIEDGYLEIEKKKFEFKRKSYLGGKISLPIIESHFEEVLNNSNEIILKNRVDNVMIRCNWIRENILLENFETLKAGIGKSLGDMDVYVEWVEENEISKEEIVLNYDIYKTYIAEGSVCNLIFFFRNKIKDQLLVGNISYFHEDAYIWKNIIKAIINLLEINI
jgi:hypothetical protein